MGTGLIGLAVVLVAVLAMWVVVRVRHGRPHSEPKRGLPEDRSTQWDPRERAD